MLELFLGHREKIRVFFFLTTHEADNKVIKSGFMEEDLKVLFL